MKISPIAIAHLIGQGRFDLSDEIKCQAEIEAFLRDRLPAGVDFAREVRLTAADRPDFVIDRTAVEVKMNSAQPRAILRQLTRYAAHPDIRAVVLVSNKAVNLPAMLSGKPVFSVSLGRAWL